ncbi:hypothetical protein SCHPADRAFT_915173 [Schizopora paradoxa]|uniref:Cupredoxin n=1 Tax=Schizopora paradoxa TaxID=27342 RepID=A0A0H2RW16_9AGAM|nr:hypothetical protein SCHPADRAFT_915173 [Schizopora paradoxa]
MRSALLILAATSLAHATNIFIQVASPSNGDNTTTFTPQRVTAGVGDIVFFNFTDGNHTATQSTFAGPCIFAASLNGFDSGFRPNLNGTDVPTPIQSVPILDSNANTPLWFFDASPGACGSGAVGVINSNENGNETLAAFVRNAERLNGTMTTSSSPSATNTSPASSTTTSSSDAKQHFHVPFLMSILAPVLFAMAQF